jgi:hypothetical protein
LFAFGRHANRDAEASAFILPVALSAVEAKAVHGSFSVANS